MTIASGLNYIFSLCLRKTKNKKQNTQIPQENKQASKTLVFNNTSKMYLTSAS